MHIHAFFFLFLIDLFVRIKKYDSLSDIFSAELSSYNYINYTFKSFIFCIYEHIISVIKSIQNVYICLKHGHKHTIQRENMGVCRTHRSVQTAHVLIGRA